MQRQWSLSDMFGGILFAAILQSTWFTYVRVLSGLGFASIFGAIAVLALEIIVSIVFAVRIRSILICLLAVTIHWISMFVYDLTHSELRGGIWDLAKAMSVGLAIHLLLQYAVGKTAQVYRERIGREPEKVTATKTGEIGSIEGK